MAEYMGNINSTTGLNEDEQKVMDHITGAYRHFVCLERLHPDELRDFTDAVHTLQRIMATRLARRVYPMGWPSYRRNGE